jgi:hypothetical protein
MAKALWIKREDLVRNTALGGNIDTDKFIQFISIAQDIHIQNYTGTKLYDKISNDIIAGTLANPYLALVRLPSADGHPLGSSRVHSICSVYDRQWRSVQA